METTKLDVDYFAHRTITSQASYPHLTDGGTHSSVPSTLQPQEVRSGLHGEVPGLLMGSLNKEAVLALVHVLTLFDHPEHGLVDPVALDVTIRRPIRCLKLVYCYDKGKLSIPLKSHAKLTCISAQTNRWFLPDADVGPPQRKEPWLPILPRLVLVEDSLGHPTHVRDLVRRRELPVEQGSLEGNTEGYSVT